jgi:hypothetical protein
VASKRLLDVAQRVLDQYFQDYAPADAFFTVDDFAYWISVVYGKFADDTAMMIYKNSLTENGVGYITFSQDWWKSKQYEIAKKDGESFVDLDIKYVGFSYDTQNSGIQLIIPIGNKCGTLYRTTITEVWQLNHITSANISWWYVNDSKITFVNNGNSNLKSVKVFYIPKADDENFDLPSSKEFEIATQAWNFLITAKQGTPLIDQTNNLNRDKLPQGETDLSQLKPVNV